MSGREASSGDSTLAVAGALGGYTVTLISDHLRYQGVHKPGVGPEGFHYQ
jgi:hypothetical protein